MTARNIFKSRRLLLVTARRRRLDIIFKCICGTSGAVFLFVLLALVVGLVRDGYTAFLCTKILVDQENVRTLSKSQISALFARGSQGSDWTLASGDVDTYVKGRVFGRTQFPGQLNRKQQQFLDELYANGGIKMSFNTNLFLRGDSSNHELAGILASLVGSLMTVLIAILCVFPIGIIAGIYIGEFAKKSKLAILIELSAKNLASIPSIVIGIFGLSLYVGILGMPRSSALVGGLTLGILALPLIILTTKQALATTPNSIRYAALALGASPLQVLLRHSLPMSIPIIGTGFILSIARIVGETAPLLVVGMIIFVMDVPTSLSDSVTTLPAQIYLWAKNPRHGFAELTSAAVLILISLIMILNMLVGLIKRLAVANHGSD